MVVRRVAPKPSYVTVVADNPQTLDGLHAYFQAAGVASNGTPKLADVSLVPSAATAVVLFPDDFQRGEAEATIVSLRRARPKLLIVVVTGAPQHLGAALEPDGHSVPPLVLPKPAFGWTILDAIRGRTNLPPS
jgi:hypothetical protein